ncbi:hypothetical protein A6A08_19130 [Nocardiopsis sp. TSRI0078]|uniref:response regulator transcription factor n=1 Tax=unclassified Nocardiopsis TaxID=2649073 RepID=UPI00093F70E6|nr:helix-turn-helix transcriptional regulator [Nocardiopsis sp. TSRI0078]OKI22386.1 hypothetical protein A6A08_19130 [Nocardiopsis sp. TSRI0078]
MDFTGSTPSARTRRGIDSLTASEARVARLAVEGRTNREIGRQLRISHHTVDTHLRHTYQKLSVSSRVELTRLFLSKEGSRALRG